MSKINFLSELNEAQQQAVLYTEGPSLIIAGAGSGKTRVLTYRIAVLLEKGVPPHSILALTFTNKAAREMRDRIANLVGPDQATGIWMGTFHSRFANILRIEAKFLGYPPNFTIYDTIDAKNMVKQVLKDMNLSDQVYKVHEVMGRISQAKNSLLLPEAYLADAALRERDRKSQKPEMGNIYRNYCTRCFLAGAMDFDDLLLKTNILFRDFPEILEKYQNRFSHILVDEYQDTNFAQYLIVKKLAKMHQNLCVVGDDAQSIYSFRGARIENIFNFKVDYPEFKLFKLEQNYRSTQTIVDAANSVIKKNTNQIGKSVFSENQKGKPISVLRAPSDLDEGIMVADLIKETFLREYGRYNDFAILYRTNAQSRIFEDNLRKNNIPYRIFGGMSFYQRKEVKDLLAYFRLVVNPLDDVSFERIINYPKRGIGETTLGKLQEIARTNNECLWNTAVTITNHTRSFDKSTMQRVLEFCAMIGTFKGYVDTLEAYEAATKIATEAGILKELHNDKSPEGVSRFENVEEALNGIREFTATREESDLPSLDAYLQTVTLATDADTEDDDRNKVSMMTIHAAKGLEFKHVHIVGVEEELFPSAMTLGTVEELEEERRLFYVALTRAMETATLSYSERRQRWGKFLPAVPSRFIREIAREFVEMPAEKPEPDLEIDFGEERKNWGNRPARLENAKSNKYPQARPQPQVPRYEKSSAPANMRKIDRKVEADLPPNAPQPSGAQGLEIGMAVSHARFGKGHIVAFSGMGTDTRATVQFQDFGEKTLLLKFAKLDPIDEK